MIRLRLACRGTVQGVGFRPAVHRLATSFGLAGWVRNTPAGAEIEIEGAAAAAEAFVAALPAALPPLARLDACEVAARPIEGERSFAVLVSEPGRRSGALVPPDAALCADCRADMEDARDRRFRYPFTTCTNCGPRFSLVRELPYDRGRTSMACFPLCPDCEREYRDPADRRFHAEPVGCPRCGPRLWMAGEGGDRRRGGGETPTADSLQPTAGGEEGGDRRRGGGETPTADSLQPTAEGGDRRQATGDREEGARLCGRPASDAERSTLSAREEGDRRQATGDREEGARLNGRPSSDAERSTLSAHEIRAVIDEVARRLEGGAILAVKGLGGFQLACRADDEAAVARLRARKRRPTKPFAVMAAELATLRRLVVLEPEGEALLASPRAPVLLAPLRTGAPLVAGIAPGLADLGVMLPTTPLHVELLRALPAGRVLVMTSGNASDEPICRGNREAIDRLGGIADDLLLHDRDVLRRVDDSVARSEPGGAFLIRRARGYVPEPLPLPEPAGPLLALGSHLQATACLGVGADAFCSQHVGDLDGEGARAFLAEAAAGLEEFLAVRAETIVVDAHPDLASTALGERLAAARAARLLRVQHHLAHAAAVLAEHRAFPSPGETVAALALDGTGWGPDGTAWGGEWLSLDGALRWRRLASLAPLPLVGGEAAVREPWRVLVAALECAGTGELVDRLPSLTALDPARLAAVRALAGRSGWPLASGAGRLFEATGALLGLALVNGYEGEAAARLEALAATAGAVPPWDEVGMGGTAALPAAALLVAAARRSLAGEAPATVAAGFHASFCRLAVELTVAVVPSGARVVALGGGCLVNRLLRASLAAGLREAGLEPLLPRLVPPGDGGLSYGQAVLAAVADARDARADLEEPCV